MNELLLGQAADWLGIPLNAMARGVICSGVSVDTRTIKPGDLFVALEGARVDSHSLCGEAAAKGAVAALVCRDNPLISGVKEAELRHFPLLRVENVVSALGQLAAAHRQQFSPQICALTGSYGKTSTKELLFQILSLQGKTLATKGNLNTEVGVPLMLLELDASHRYAVFEMGARHPGDISTLTRLIRPHLGILLNAGMAHREIFGTDEAIAAAKGELIEGLGEEGTLVLNRESPWITLWQKRAGDRPTITFGKQEKTEKEGKTDVSASQIEFRADQLGMRFVLTIAGESLPVALSLSGAHAVSNALAAAAAAHGLGISLQGIREGLENARPVGGRLYRRAGLRGSIILDDTYNANPASMRAGLEVLARFPGKKIFVMGDMFELGDESLALHREMGKTAKRLGIERLWGVGEQTKGAVETFGSSAAYFEHKPALIEALRPLLYEQVTVLVKGSRGMKMEEVVEALLC